MTTIHYDELIPDVFNTPGRRFIGWIKNLPLAVKRAAVVALAASFLLALLDVWQLAPMWYDLSNSVIFPRYLDGLLLALTIESWLGLAAMFKRKGTASRHYLNTWMFLGLLAGVLGQGRTVQDWPLIAAVGTVTGLVTLLDRKVGLLGDWVMAEWWLGFSFGLAFGWGLSTGLLVGMVLGLVFALTTELTFFLSLAVVLALPQFLEQLKDEHSDLFPFEEAAALKALGTLAEFKLKAQNLLILAETIRLEKDKVIRQKEENGPLTVKFQIEEFLSEFRLASYWQEVRRLKDEKEVTDLLGRLDSVWLALDIEFPPVVKETTAPAVSAPAEDDELLKIFPEKEEVVKPVIQASTLSVPEPSMAEVVQAVVNQEVEEKTEEPFPYGNTVPEMVEAIENLHEHTQLVLAEVMKTDLADQQAVDDLLVQTRIYHPRAVKLVDWYFSPSNIKNKESLFYQVIREDLFAHEKARGIATVAGILGHFLNTGDPEILRNNLDELRFHLELPPADKGTVDEAKEKPAVNELVRPVLKLETTDHQPRPFDDAIKKVNVSEPKKPLVDIFSFPDYNAPLPESKA